MPWWSLSSKSGKSPDAQDGTTPLLHPTADWHAATTKTRPSSRKRPRQSWSAPSLPNDTLSAGPATPTHSPPPPIFSRAACVREKGPPSPPLPSLSRQDLVSLLCLALNMQQVRPPPSIHACFIGLMDICPRPLLVLHRRPFLTEEPSYDSQPSLPPSLPPSLHT